ncbi:MAG: GNAT family N-acetyltransferase [Mycolicibacterium neoaurum]|uniref:GNAT family N-acetyltransferase n=1 Tax=Mycolicibacterium neoaurum TaxID=1795 RepID=UPI002FF84309
MCPSAGSVLCTRRIVRADWQWIAAWFGDEELNRRLGPLDEEWLEHVLAESAGVQLVITDADGAPVGLAGCAWGPSDGVHAITDLAVCPWRRRSGLGREVLSAVLSWGDHPPTRGWVAFVDPDNRAAVEFFVAAGWHVDGDEDGMHRFHLVR